MTSLLVDLCADGLQDPCGSHEVVVDRPDLIGLDIGPESCASATSMDCPTPVWYLP
jgi:hypothetical protein